MLKKIMSQNINIKCKNILWELILDYLQPKTT